MIANLQAHWGFTTMPFGRTIAVDNLFRKYSALSLTAGRVGT